MATEGRTEYEINVSGNLDEKFDSFLSKVAKLDAALGRMGTSLKAIDKVKSADSSRQSESKAVSQQKESLKVQDQINSSKKKEEKILVEIEASERARKRIINDTKKAQLENEIATNSQLRNLEASLIAEKNLSAVAIQRKVAEEEVRLAQAKGAVTVSEIAALTKVNKKTIEEILGIEKQATVEKDRALDVMKQQAAVAERTRETIERNRNAQQKIVTANGSIATSAVGAAKGTETISKETDKAAKNTNKLLLSFRQVLFTVIRFKIARSIFNFITNSVEEMSRFNAEIELSEKSIASLIASVGQVRDVSGRLASGIDAFRTSLTLSKDIVNQLRIDAARTEATFEGLVNAFQVAVAPGLAAGLNLEEIRKTTINITRAATQLGVPVRQLSEEIRSVLQGTIRLNNTRLAPLFDNEDIRKATEQGTLFQLLSERLKVYEESADDVADTFKVLASNIQDSTSILLASGSREYFNSLKEIMREIIGAISSSDGLSIVNPQAQRSVKNLSNGMAVFIDQIKDVVKAGDVMDAFERATKAVGAALKVLGAIAEPVINGISIAIEAILSPLEALVFLWEKLSGVINDKVGQTVQDIAKYFVAWLITAKVLSITVGSIQTVLTAHKAILAVINALQARVQATATATAAANAANTVALQGTSAVLTGITAKMALITGGFILVIGLLVSGILKYIASTEKAVDRLSEMSSLSDKLAKTTDGFRESMYRVPASVYASSAGLKDMNKYLEESSKRAKELRTEFDIKKIVLETKEGLRELVNIREQELAKARGASEQERKTLASTEERIKILEQEIGTRKEALTAELKSIEALDKRQEELFKLKESGKNVDRSILELNRERAVIDANIEKIVQSTADAKVEAAQKEVAAAKEALLQNKKFQEQTEKNIKATRRSLQAASIVDAPDVAKQLDRQFLALKGYKVQEKKLTEELTIAEQKQADVIKSRTEDVARLNGLIEEQKQRRASLAEVESKANETAKEAIRIKALDLLIGQKKFENDKKSLELDNEFLALAKENADTTREQSEIEYKLLQNRIAIRKQEFKVEKDVLNAQIDQIDTLMWQIEDKQVLAELSDLMVKKQKELTELERSEASIIGELTKAAKKLNEARKGDGVSDIEAQLSKVEVLKDIAAREAQIARLGIENQAASISNANKLVGLAELDVLSKQRAIDLSNKEYESNLALLQAKKAAAKEPEDRLKLEQDIQNLIAARPSIIRLEQAEIEALLKRVQELRLKTSNEIGLGIRTGLQDFVAGSEGIASNFRNIVVSGLDGVATTTGKVFSDAIDPRKNANVGSAFADLFYSLAGQFAEAVTKQLIAKTVTVALEQSSAGILQNALTYLASALGIQTAATQAQTIATTANTTAVSAEAGAGVASTGISAAASAVSEGGGIIESIALVPLVTAIVGELGIVAGLLAGMLASDLVSVVLLSGIFAAASLMAGIQSAQLAQSIIQTAILGLIQLFTAIEAANPFAKGGLVEGYASGGKIRGAGAFPRPKNIPRSDTVPAWLTPGEFVIKLDSVKKYGLGFLSAINEGLVDPASLMGISSASIATGIGPGIKAFAEGGAVTSGSLVSATGRKESGVTILPVVVANNDTTEEMLSGGRNAFEKSVNRVNIIGDANASRQW